MTVRTGRFISFEGGEGVGKSTQIKVLEQRLRLLGHKVHVTREPGGCSSAEALRTLLVTGDKGRWSPMSEALLMTAARVEHIRQVIVPMIEDGVHVITDRFYHSTLAYQGAGHQLGVERMRHLQHLAFGDLVPDRTLILDTVSDALDRARKREKARDDEQAREDRFESYQDDFHARVGAAFREFAHDDGVSLIDANGSIEAVSERIWADLEPLFRGHHDGH